MSTSERTREFRFVTVRNSSFLFVMNYYYLVSSFASLLDKARVFPAKVCIGSSALPVSNEENSSNPSKGTRRAPHETPSDKAWFSARLGDSWIPARLYYSLR